MRKQLLNRALVLLMATTVPVMVVAQTSAWESTPQRNYEDARRLFDEGLYAAAMDGFMYTLKELGAGDRGDVAEQCSYFKALCSVRLMNRDAEDVMERFLQDYPTSARRKEAILETTAYFFNRKKYSDARTWLRRLEGLYLNAEEKATYKFQLGYSYMMLDERKNAQLQFKEIKDGKSSLATSAKYYYGHLAYLDSNYVTAIQNLVPLKEDPQFGMVVPYYLAQMYYQTGDDATLYTLGQELLKNVTTKRAPEIAKLVGQSLYRQKLYKEAVPFLQMHRDKGGVMRPEDHYQLGVVMHASGKYKEAMESLTKLSSGKTALAQSAYFLLGDAYLKEGLKSEALAAFKAASEMDFDKRIQEEAMFHFAKLTYATPSPFAKPMDAFQQFLAKYPQSEFKRDANAYLANLYTTSKDYDKALEAIQATGLTSMAMREAYQKVAYFLGVERYNSADWAGAQEYFAQSLSYPLQQTYVALTHFWLGELAYRKGDAQEALARFEQFMKTPGSYTLSEMPVAQYNKAYCLYQLGKYDQAATAFRLFLDNQTADVRRKQDATLRVADAYFLQGRYAQAEEFYRNYASSKLNDADYALFQRALSLGLLGKHEDKLNVLRSVKTTYPQSKWALDSEFEMAATLARLNQPLEAAEAYFVFAKSHPNASNARKAMLNSALAYRNAGQAAKAASVLTDVVNKFPSTQEAKEAVTAARAVYDEMNRLEEYLDWVSALPHSGVTHTSLDSVTYNSAYEKWASGKNTEALSAFSSYLKRYPEGAFVLKAHHYRAESARGLSQWEEAVSSYRYVSDAPRSEYTENAYRWLGAHGLSRKNYAEAQTAFERLLTISEKPEDFRRANEGLMRTTAVQKQHGQALQYAESVLSDDKQSPEIRNEALVIKARSLWSLGDTSRAIEAYSTVRNHVVGGAKAEGSYFLAWSFRSKKQFVDSNEEIFWLVDNAPGQAEWRYKALLLLAQNYWDMNDAFQANYSLDFIIEDNYDPAIVQEAQKLKSAYSVAPGVTSDNATQP